MASVNALPVNEFDMLLSNSLGDAAPIIANEAVISKPTLHTTDNTCRRRRDGVVVIPKFEIDDSSPRLLEINDSVWISSSSVGGASACISMLTEMVVVSALDGLNVGESVGLSVVKLLDMEP